MTELLEKKKQAFSLLLEITEEMNKLLECRDFDSMYAVTSRRDTIIRIITGIDEEGVDGETKSPSHNKLNELLAIIKRIVDLNESMIISVSERLHAIDKELNELSRGAAAAAKYAKMGAI